MEQLNLKSTFGRGISKIKDVWEAQMECDRCSHLEQEVAVLKERLTNFEKQYSDDRLADQKDLQEIDDDLDTLLKSQHTLEVIRKVGLAVWGFCMGLATLVWAVTQILSFYRGH